MTYRAPFLGLALACLAFSGAQAADGAMRYTAHLDGASEVPKTESKGTGDVTATYADVSALNALTGYRPRVMLAEGLSRFVDWYRGYYRG